MEANSELGAASSVQAYTFLGILQPPKWNHGKLTAVKSSHTGWNKWSRFEDFWELTAAKHYNYIWGKELSGLLNWHNTVI